jgi:hypothetical protein
MTILKKIEGEIEVTGRKGRRRKQLLDNLNEKRRYWKLKKGLDRTLWRTRFARNNGPVGIQTTGWMNEWMNESHRVPFRHKSNPLILYILTSIRTRTSKLHCACVTGSYIRLNSYRIRNNQRTYKSAIKQFPLAINIQRRLWEVLSSNLDGDTLYRDWGFSCCASVLPGKCQDTTSMRQQVFSSEFFTRQFIKCLHVDRMQLEPTTAIK